MGPESSLRRLLLSQGLNPVDRSRGRVSTGVHGAAAAPAQSPSSPFWMQVDGGSQTLGVTGAGKAARILPCGALPSPQ